MRRLRWISAAVLLALAAAGVAVAEEGENRSTKAVSATFSAEAGDHAIRTCQGADGRYRRIHGLWEGESESSEPALDGELALKGTAWVHVPTGNGSFRGRLRVGGEQGLVASLNGVLKDGKLEGLAVGHAGEHEARLVANVSASFSAEAIADGKLGGGGGANTAVLAKGGCPARDGEEAEKKREKADERREEAQKRREEAEKKREGEKKPGRTHREARGAISAFGESSISIAAEGAEPLTCSLGERLGAELRSAGYAVGTAVHAVCVDEGRGFVLVKIRKL